MSSKTIFFVTTSYTLNYCYNFVIFWFYCSSSHFLPLLSANSVDSFNQNNFPVLNVWNARNDKNIIVKNPWKKLETKTDSFWKFRKGAQENVSTNPGVYYLNQEEWNIGILYNIGIQLFVWQLLTWPQKNVTTPRNV